jgi:hypothetical protein
MRLHAATYIDEQQKIEGVFFAREMTNRLCPAFFAQNEILNLQAADCVVVSIQGFHLYADEGNVAAKNDRDLFRLR